MVLIASNTVRVLSFLTTQLCEVSEIDCHQSSRQATSGVFFITNLDTVWQGGEKKKKKKDVAGQGRTL